MERIYFDDNTKSKNFIILFISIIGLMSVSLFIMVDKKTTITSFLLGLFFAMFLISLFGKMSIRKNYVSWSKKSISIKIHSLFPKDIFFKNVLDNSFENKKLKITLKNDKEYHFDLSHIEENDINKLEGIINKHSNI